MFLPKTWLICRICLKQTHKMLNLFTKHCDLPIWNILRDVAGIPVRKDDNLSDRICETCLDRLWKAHAFRLDCQRAHRALTQVVQYGGKKSVKNLPAVTDHTAKTKVIQCEGKTNPELLPVDDGIIGHKSKTHVVQCGGNKCSELLPVDAVIVTPGLVDPSNNREVEPSISCANDDDLIHHNSEPETESKLNDHQCITKIDPITSNRFEEDTSNLKYPAIDHEKQDVPANRQQTALKTKRQTTPKSKTEKKATNNPRSHPSTIYCSICKSCFSSKIMLRQHMYTHIKPHMCRLCGKTFTQKRHIKNHLNTHYGLRPHLCRLCPSRFADISNRNKHERSVHKRERLHNYGKPKECFICGLKFATVSELRNHHNVHLKPVFKEEAV